MKADADVDSCTVLSLASGIGGLDLGFKLAVPAARTVCYVERDISAISVLVKAIEEKKLDDAPIWTDARTFDGNPWRGVVDWVIGGYPCQPFSIAGNRQGHGDPRNLWPAFKRIIGEIRPNGCFFENVGQHLRDGYFDVVRPDLERLGYSVTETIVNASEVGAPHRRQRLFILATNDSGEGRKGLVASKDSREARSGRWGGEEDLPLIPNSPFVNGHSWPQPLVRGVDDGITDRVDRLHMIGNAVIPEQAAFALQVLNSHH